MSKIYCMSDIHGCLGEFEESLNLVMNHIKENDVKLLLLGDYIHGGSDSYRVLDKIMDLQDVYGEDKVLALMGNHEDFVTSGYSGIEEMMYGKNESESHGSREEDDYIRWMSYLPKYYKEGNTIFCHAGIDEEAGELWEWGTSDDVFVGKYPADVGKIEGVDMKVVAGHVGTAEIADNPKFHEIFFDGESHYYIDGTVLDSGRIPVLLVDTETDKYYQVTENGAYIVPNYYEY